MENFRILQLKAGAHSQLFKDGPQKMTKSKLEKEAFIMTHMLIVETKL
jgi:hypothetical protein